MMNFLNHKQEELHLAMMEVPAELILSCCPDMQVDADSVTCLRSVLMKPEQQDWLDPIMHILEASAAA